MKENKEPNHSNIDCEKGIGKNCPPREVSYNNSNWRYKKLASGFIKHSPSAEADITFFIELMAVMEEMDESQRRELQPVADVFLQACRERRENEMYDKMLASLERRYPGMHDMMLASYESLNHVSRESARPQPEEDGDIKLSTEDMKTLVKCFKGNEKNAISFLEEVKKIGENRKITAIVNKLVEDGKINKSYRGRLLWTILDKYGLYTCTEANWNMRIK